MGINPPYLDRNLPISPARLPTCGEEKVRMVNILSLKSCDAFLSMDWLPGTWCEGKSYRKPWFFDIK